MKFFCEYCGCRIDSEKDKKCPNCGASYKKNATFIKHEEERKEKELQAEEFAQKTIKSANRAKKLILIFFAVIFGIILLTTITSIFGFGIFGKKVSTSITNQVKDQITDDSKKITVGIDEYAKLDKYQVKVTGYEVDETNLYKNLKDGYEYVTFHLMVENLTNNRITDENVNCIVDGVAQTNKYSSGYSTLPWIDANLTVIGDATFEVPIDATSYDIRYGDYVTIHIEKE